MGEPEGAWSDGAWRWSAPCIVRTRLTLAGEAVEHCAFGADTCVNPDPEAVTPVRRIMGGRGAVVLVPRHPLAPSGSYEVEVVTDRGTQVWTFHTADEATVSRAARPLDGWGFEKRRQVLLFGGDGSVRDGPAGRRPVVSGQQG